MKKEIYPDLERLANKDMARIRKIADSIDRHINEYGVPSYEQCAILTFPINAEVTNRKAPPK